MIAYAGQGTVWDHLLFRPATGTFLRALPSGRVFQVISGRPIYVPSWASVGGVHPTVVGQRCDHRPRRPGRRLEPPDPLSPSDHARCVVSAARPSRPARTPRPPARPAVPRSARASTAAETQDVSGDPADNTSPNCCGCSIPLGNRPRIRAAPSATSGAAEARSTTTKSTVPARRAAAAASTSGTAVTDPRGSVAAANPGVPLTAATVPVITSSRVAGAVDPRRTRPPGPDPGSRSCGPPTRSDVRERRDDERSHGEVDVGDRLPGRGRHRGPVHVVRGEPERGSHLGDDRPVQPAGRGQPWRADAGRRTDRQLAGLSGCRGAPGYRSAACRSRRPRSARCRRWEQRVPPMAESSVDHDRGGHRRGARRPSATPRTTASGWFSVAEVLPPGEAHRRRRPRRARRPGQLAGGSPRHRGWPVVTDVTRSR